MDEKSRLRVGRNKENCEALQASKATMFLTECVTGSSGENKATIKYASIAQLAEHAAVNRGVTGSSPV